MMINDIYIEAFRNVIHETERVTGYTVPEPVKTYVVMLLSSYMDRTNFMPNCAFIEELLSLYSHRKAKELGDTCLFLTGVFPEYGKRYGIDKNYYIGIGMESYNIASRQLNDQLLKMLSDNFSYLQRFIEISTKPNILREISICR
jgi:hypothetical protein